MRFDTISMYAKVHVDLFMHFSYCYIKVFLHNKVNNSDDVENSIVSTESDIVYVLKKRKLNFVN